jgi:Tfp pilus assembly protein FimT
MARPSTIGMTMVEIVVVLAVLALVVVVGFSAFGSGNSVGRAARDVAAVVRLARWAAVSAGGATVVLEGDAGDLVRAAGSGFGCRPGDAAQIVWRRPQAVVLDWPRAGLAFAPDGRPRRCDGAGVGNTTIAILGRDGSRAAVIVAVTGRVRWELR